MAYAYGWNKYIYHAIVYKTEYMCLYKKKQSPLYVEGL